MKMRLVAVAALAFSGLCVNAIDMETDATTLQWQPLSKDHVESYFRRPAFSVEPHVEAFQDHHHRRLLAQVSDERRLTAEECSADMKKWREKYTTTISDRYAKLKAAVGVDKLDIRGLVQKLPEFGEAIRNFDFASLGKVTIAGFFGSMIVVEGITLAADYRKMMSEAREVINTIRKVEEVVRRIGSEVLEMMERTDFDHFINAARASADAVFDDGITKSDELLAVCRGFDYSQITQLSTTMESFQICTRETDKDKLTKCKLNVGVAGAGTMVLSLSAAAMCDAHVAISQSHSSHPMSSLKHEAETFIQSLMQMLVPGNTSDPDWKEANDAVLTYSQNITDIANQAAPLDDPDSADSYVRDALADLHSRTFSSLSDVQNFTASALYGNMTALNPDAGAAGAIVGIALAKSQDQVMGKLGALKDKVEDQHNERMALYDTINNTLWTNHAEFMGQVDHMSTTFTAQHNERLGRLKGVENSLSNIQSSTSNGFAQLRGRIQDMGRKFVSQVQGIESNVVSTGAETTNYLSNAVIDANRQIENRINGVGDTVIRSHEMVMSAIGDAQNTAVSEFTATQNVLYQASDTLRMTIDNGLGAVADAASNAFNTINDVVYKRMEESHSILEQLMAGMSSDFALVEDKLVILENRAANMSKQLDVAKDFLLEIHLRFDQIQQMLDDLPTVVQQEMFQSDVDGLHRKYQNMRKVYRDYLDSDLPIKTIAESCASFQIYDLFLRFLRIVDVSDEELPRQLENFGYDGAGYEQFAIMVVGILNDLSFFDGVCAKAQFSATLKELEDKAQEQANMILSATAKLAHQVEEVIPVLVLENRVLKRMGQISDLAWDVEGAMTVETLRAEFQAGLGDFAYVTVIHAGKDGQLAIDHLDRDSGSKADGLPRKSGVIVSDDQKMAVMWSQTRRVSADKMNSVNQTELLRQGIYRGNITASSQSCFLAASSDDYYPSCDKCSCIHYEDFASLSDPMAGRAVAYLADKTYDSAFVVETVKTSGADYSLNFIQLNVGSLTPGAVATAQFQAPVISSSTKQSAMRVLWDGTSTIGRFDVVPSDIKGTLLSENELTLSVTHGTKQFRHTFPLFCDGYVKLTSLPEFDVQLRYACREVLHDSASPDIVKQGYAYVSSGLPLKRLSRSICSQDNTRQVCKVGGAVDAISVSGSRFTFGEQVSEVTMFTSQGFRGPFAICRDCSTKTLTGLTTTYVFQTVYIGVPDAPPEMAEIECAESQVGNPDKLLLCRPASDST